MWVRHQTKCQFHGHWLQAQGRFKHLFKPGNEGIIEALQEEVDRKWELLLQREAASQAAAS